MTPRTDAGDPSEKHSFWCVRDELVLGAYRDGYWMVSSDALDDPTEQIVVSLHERLHHELQYTTPWGVMTEMLSLVANRDPSRAGAFRRVAGFGKNASRTVHEVYATTHSVGARARHVAWLESNEAHRPFYDLGVRLSLGDLEASRFLFDALVRCSMSPAGLANVVAGGLDDLSLRTLDGAALRPDDGLVRILDLELSALADVKPSGRSAPALASYHDDVAQILRSQGFAVLTSDGSREVVMSIVASVASIDPELADLIELDSEREPTADDVEASQRERIVLRTEPLPLVLTEQVAATDLMLHDEVLGPHVLLLWAARGVFETQFHATDLGTGDHFVAIVAPLVVGGVVRAIRGLVVDGDGGPDALAEHLGAVPTVVMTTSSTLMDAPASARSEHVPVLYALIDGPILYQLEHSFGSRGRATWDSYDARRGSELCVTVFSLDVLPGIRWIHVGTIAARSYLVTWLEGREGIDAQRVKGAFDAERPAIDIVARFVRHAWRVLSQGA